MATSPQELPSSSDKQIMQKAASIGSRLLKPAIVVASAAAIAHGVTGENKADTTKTDAATTEITSDIALGHGVGVIEGGSAVVSLDDGSKVRITNPIVARNGAVAERTRGSDKGELSAVTTYAEGEAGVEDVAYFEDPKAAKAKYAGEPTLESDGKSSPDEAALLAAGHSVQVERADGLSGGGDPGESPEANYFEPTPEAAAQLANPDRKIAQGTEHNPGEQLNQG